RTAPFFQAPPDYPGCGSYRAGPGGYTGRYRAGLSHSAAATGTGSPRYLATPQVAQPGAHNNYTYHQAGQVPVYDVEWSPDGTRIISANENVTSWDAFSGSHKVMYTGSSAQKPQILFTQISPDGKTLAIWNITQIDLYN